MKTLTCPWLRPGRLWPGWTTRRWWILLVLATLVAAGSARAEVLRTQTFELLPGWNAVFLEVEPANRDPVAVFAGVPVDIVATFFPQAQPVFYPRNPDEHPWQEEGWGVWYEPRRPDAFVSNMHLIRGNQAYLIHATAAYSWKLQGKMSHRPIEWEPNSFTFTGFSLDPAAPPTFERFFAGSRAHRGQKVFRLVDGRWTLVRYPATTAMRAGEAYWIFSKGTSRFQGPIEIQLAAGNGLAFGSSANGLQVEFVNASDAPAQFMMETLPDGEGLPLSYEYRNLKTLVTVYPTLPAVMALPPLEPLAKTSLRLFVRREDLGAGGQSGWLKISDGGGTLRWIPVSASSAQPH